MCEIASGKTTGCTRIRESSFFDGIVQQIPCGLTRIDIQTGYPVGVIMVEHQTSALLVGPVERHVSGRWCGRGAGWKSKGSSGECSVGIAVRCHCRATERHDVAICKIHIRY